MEKQQRHSDSTQALIELRGVSRRYRQSGSEQVVLERCSATFDAGKCHVLLGRSGSGKSTLLNMIGGIDVPDEGAIIVGGKDITALDERALTLYRRRDIGYIFQFFHLIPSLTVLENVTLPQELDGAVLRNLTERAMRLLDRVGLAHKAQVMPDTLSGGEQQRVAIVRALAHDPLLVLADEPTGNLDAETGEHILQLLLELTRESGRTLIMATHSHEVLPYADAVFDVRERTLQPIGIDDLLRQEQALQQRTDSLRGGART